MSTSVVVTHPCSLLHEGLRQTLRSARFGPVRISSSLSERTQKYFSSVESCLWLYGVQRCVSDTCATVTSVVSKSPGVKAVIFAAYRVPGDATSALESGACGFLSQEIDGAALVKSLDVIARGGTVVDQCLTSGSRFVAQSKCCELQAEDADLLAPIGYGSAESTETAGNRALSYREEQVLRKLVGGASNKEIAFKLVMTEATVKVHMKAILRKLRFHNRTEAALWARNNLSFRPEESRDPILLDQENTRINDGLASLLSLGHNGLVGSEQ